MTKNLIKNNKLHTVPKSSETIKKLEKIKTELEEIREKIKGNNLSNLVNLEYNKNLMILPQILKSLLFL